MLDAKFRPFDWSEPRTAYPTYRRRIRLDEIGDLLVESGDLVVGLVVPVEAAARPDGVASVIVGLLPEELTVEKVDMELYGCASADADSAGELYVRARLPAGTWRVSRA